MEDNLYTRRAKKWYKNGKLHRENGPAVEDASGSCQWYKNGKLHRIGGPSIEWLDGSKQYYLYGRRYDQIAYETAVSMLFPGIDKSYIETKTQVYAKGVSNLTPEQKQILEDERIEQDHEEIVKMDLDVSCTHCSCTSYQDSDHLCIHCTTTWERELHT